MLPNLETPRLALRPLGLADLEDWLAMDLDPSVARFIWGAPPDPEAHREVLQGRFANAWPKLGGIWVVEERAAPGFLGWCGLFPLEKTGLIEIGYRYLPKAWGRGIATEAAGCVLDQGFRSFAFDPIVAVSHPDNLASHRVLQKIGLVRQADAVHYRQKVSVFHLSRADYLASDQGQGTGPAKAATPSGPPRPP
jgi:RimJ/RimL family protein N-acetyltransferase